MTTGTLDLSTTLLVRRFASGDCLVAPITDLALGSFGPEGHCLSEQRVFLSEHLARITPEEVARFGLPEGIRITLTDVVIPREALPRRLQMREAITVPAVVIPSGEDLWVILVPLKHTFYVRKDEKLDEAVRAEVIRLSGALELSAFDYLNLLPAREHTLESVEVSIDRPERLPAERRASMRRVLAERHRSKWAAEVLESVGIPMHLRSPKHLSPLVAREAELKQLSALLDGKQRLSVLLQGPSLAGKSALLKLWLHEKLKVHPDARVYLSSGAQLIAGMSGLGQWEERVRRVMEAAEALDATLVFDNLGDLLSDHAEGSSGGGVDIPNALKPWIEDLRVRVVGELRDELVDHAERRHAGFLGCLSRLKVSALDPQRALEALYLRIGFEAKHQPHRVRLRSDAAPTLVDLCERYLPYQSFPGKVMRLYDDLRASHESDQSPRQGDPEPAQLGADSVHELFSIQSGIPAFLLREDRALRLEDIVSELARRVVGQTEAVRRVAETVCVVKAQLQPQGKPLATLLFVGPTGVGKTELARALAALLFSREDRMVRFDMSEFTDEEAADRLIRGSGRAEGLLTRKVREQPFGVLLLDEIEKAHPAVFDLLLQVCGEGRLTDGAGRTAFFHNSIIIMTSNLGAASAGRPAAGFTQLTESHEKFYAREVDRSFRPEFVNRLDRIVAFQALSAEEVGRVARIALDKITLRRGLSAAGVTLRVSDRALESLVLGGYSARYGARALRRHLEDHLVVPASKLLSLVGTAVQPDEIQCVLESESEVFPVPEASVSARVEAELGMRFELFRAKSAGAVREQKGLAKISAVRRGSDRLMSLYRVDELKSQIEYLTTQMNYGSEGQRYDKRNALEVAELQGEHHRLSLVWDALEKAHGQILDIEEVGLMSLFEKSSVEELSREVSAVDARFRKALAYALVAMEPRRDQLTLLLTELDELRGFDRWLVALLDHAPARGWHVDVHIDAGERDPESDWPAHRRWGPPRDAVWMRARLAERERSFRNVLVRVKGPFAGVFLALEAGLHRWQPGASGDQPVQMYARLIAMSAQIKDTDWAHPVIMPDVGNRSEERRRSAPARWTLDSTLRVQLPGKRWLPLGGGYFEAIEQMVVTQLLPYEDDDAPERGELFSGPLDPPYGLRS